MVHDRDGLVIKTGATVFNFVSGAYFVYTRGRWLISESEELLLSRADILQLTDATRDSRSY